jgi:hypothetical protein
MKHHGERHPVSGHLTRHGPEHQRQHDEALAHEHHGKHKLSFRHPSDHEHVPMPHEPGASHNQGQQHRPHGGYVRQHGLTKAGTTAENRKADGRKAGDGY